MPAGAERLDSEYILAPGAALMLDAAPPAPTPRPPATAAASTGAASAAARASQVYERLGQ